MNQQTNLSDWGDQILRVAIVSDTHGFIDSRILDITQRCHIAVHAGDIGSRSVLTSMKPETGLVFAVAGNNDTVSICDPSEAEFVADLPMVQVIPLPGGTLAVEHGHTVRDRRYHEVLRQRHADSRAIVYGHWHLRTIDQGERQWVLNPCAGGRERTNGGASCLVLEICSDDWRVSEHCFVSQATRQRQVA